MIYKVIGMMSGSSLDGLDIVYVHLHEAAGKWNYEIFASGCYDYTHDLKAKLSGAINLSALDYQQLHVNFGHYLGERVNEFIEKNALQHKVDLIVSHGHTTFHFPAKKLTAQLGDGAAIAAETKLPVVNELRAMDIAFGGQGAPIVPAGEKLLFADHDCFLNIGGIANITFNNGQKIIAFDICPANRILNMLAEKKGLPFDDDGKIARAGTVDDALLQKLNALEYYKLPNPKSLSNQFGTNTIIPILENSKVDIHIAMRTYVEHIVVQIKNAFKLQKVEALSFADSATPIFQLFATGGGALNSFLMERLKLVLDEINVTVIIPDTNVVLYKEALIMALLGTLRWREEYNIMNSVTGATRNSIGGALWLGTEA
ncbi:MAG: anhydro-N-acetylmuramic acid kinase [Chitinophagaceae bacterium]|nr:anhydro-N-acetylmuramic acid kinase [Chitinophagaceae bacterium]